MKIRSSYLLAAVIFPAVILPGIWLIFHFQPSNTPQLQPVQERAEEQQKIIQETLRQAAPAIVKISGNRQNTSCQTNGFLIRPDSLVTQYQTLPAGETFSVTVNGRQYTAKFAGADPVTDLAILQIPGGNFSFLRFASPQSVQPGVKVLAAVPGKTSSGIITGINGTFLQMDTVTFAGSSGCPLLNLRGEVLGIHLAPHENAALSLDVIRNITEELIQHGFVPRPYLGILLDENMQIRAVAKHSPAADSLDPGDLLLKVNGQKLTSPQELLMILEKTGAEAEIFLEIRRGSRELSGSLILRQTPRNWYAVFPRPPAISGKAL